MKVEVKTAGAIVVVVLLLASATYTYLQFEKHRYARSKELETVEIRFNTLVIDEQPVLNMSVLRYTDVTYLDLKVELINHGDKVIEFKNPRIKLYLEDLLVKEEAFGDLPLRPGPKKSLPIEEITFETEIINEALKGKTHRPEEVLYVRGEFSSKYVFSIQNIRLKTYSLSKSFEARLLLRQIFGGKTQEEAVEDILSLNILGHGR